MAYLHVLYDQLCGDTLVLMASAMSLLLPILRVGCFFTELQLSHFPDPFLVHLCPVSGCTKVPHFDEVRLSIFVFQVGSPMAQAGLKLSRVRVCGQG